MKTAMIAAAAAIGACAQLPANAEHWDVIAMEMTGECTVAEYMEIVADFNEWAEPRGYSAKLAIPTHSDNLDTYFWIGSSPDGATFGAAYDEWVSGLGDPDSGPSQLMARFSQCADNLQRTSYFVQ